MKKKHNWTILILLLVFLFIFYFIYKDQILEGLSILSKGNITEMKDWIHSWGILAPIISILFMIIQAVAAPLPSFIITGANGIVFGVFWGIVISWIGAMLGALLTFYLAKWFGKKIINEKDRENKWIKKMDHFNGKHGFLIILLARIIPVVSFDLISYAAGLSRMKTSTFLLATGIGMIPGTVIYTILGHDFIQLGENWGRFLSFAILLCLLLFIGYRKKDSFFPSKDSKNKE